MEENGKTVYQNLNAMMGLIEQKTCEHENAQVVYDHSMRMISKCYDCGNETILEHPIVASTGSTHNYSTALGQNSIAIGYSSKAFGCTNIAIGASVGCRVNTDKDDFKYAGDYSGRSLTDKSIIDMGFLDDMKEALENAEMRQEKAMKNYKDKQLKLDNIAEKVRAIRSSMSNDGNTHKSEIDRIKEKYDDIVNRQKVAQEQQSSNHNLINDFLGKKSIGLQSPPPPPPMPQSRRIGNGWNVGTEVPSHNETPSKSLSKFTDIEYVQFLFTGVEVEEKTYKDVEYLDFTFYNAVDQKDSKLNILEKGDVIKWEKVAKNKKMGMLSPKIKAIKAIRISVKDLEEARNPQEIED